jgi:hypothetical protein
MNTSICVCTNTTVGLTQQNAAECSDRCSDGSPCGSPAGRLSLYELTKPVNPAVVTSVVGSSPTPVAGTTDNTTLGRGDSLNQKQIALYASLGAAVVIVVIAVILFIRHKKKQASIPTLPRHGSRKNEKFLIPNLPATTNLIYSVHTSYKPNQLDELVLNKDDVVCLQSYSGDWGLGTNVTTGEKGYVPLACFLDPKFAVNIPKRDGTTVLL